MDKFAPIEQLLRIFRSGMALKSNSLLRCRLFSPDFFIRIQGYRKIPEAALFNGLHVPQDMTESVRLAAEAVR
jgi:hypothetical protein